MYAHDITEQTNAALYVGQTVCHQLLQTLTISGVIQVIPIEFRATAKQ
jgi:hypothetical protein